MFQRFKPKEKPSRKDWMDLDLFERTGFPFIKKDVSFYDKEDHKDYNIEAKSDRYLARCQELYDAFTAKYQLEPDEAEVYQMSGYEYDCVRVRKAKKERHPIDQFILALAQVTQYWQREDLDLYCELSFDEREKLWNVIEQANTIVYR